MRNARFFRGFTLIELMVAVAVLAILTTTAVVSYKRYIRKGRMTEAIAFLSDIKMKQATYFSMYGHYVDTSAAPASYSDSDYYPPTVGDKPVAWDIDCPDDQNSFPGWCSLGCRPTDRRSVSFQYVTVGWQTGDPNPSNAFIQDPTRNWWFAVARGDLDGNTIYSTFLISSEMAEVAYWNETE